MRRLLAVRVSPGWKVSIMATYVAHSTGLASDKVNASNT